MSNSSATTWTVACQAPLSMGFSRQESWSELPFPPPGDLLDPGIEPVSPASAGRFFTTEPPGKPYHWDWSNVNLFSRVWLFATRWTVAYQAPQSMEFFRQEGWSGLPFPSPGDLPDPGVEPRFLALQANTSLSEPPGKPYHWDRYSLILMNSWN